ncbi:MAG: single-stranded-DNA-specific exonuclease RecJ [Leptolyngbyaceae cyanobacterium]
MNLQLKTPPTGSSTLPRQRWQIADPHPAQAEEMAQAFNLSPLLAQVLINRGVDSLEQAHRFLNPETEELPCPLQDFADLALALELLITAIHQHQPIAICGDYDADGMTSTALLMRALRSLGAWVDYAIPSRMTEGYGLNQRIVEDFHAEGVGLILTVDNGIAAHAAIDRARALGMVVIVTDHHDIPPQLPAANAILNPKLIPETSPYRGLAGVGVAYILAEALANSLGQAHQLGSALLELFTLGTIADLAPLTGVNRRWVRQGLQLLPKSTIAGVQALIQVSGLSDAATIKPEAIGFRLGPRINAVGRLADPQIVIELLTTDDAGSALERAMQCEQINQERQQLCAQIEQEAIACYEAGPAYGQDHRVLVLVQPAWHHGVIGIVASRLVERYGLPVFIGTFEDDHQQMIRGSARGIPEFHVFEALETAKDLLAKHGGHRAAGGFSFAADHLEALCNRLQAYAHTCLEPDHLSPLVQIDGQTTLEQIDASLYQQIDRLHPCGIANPEPVFWTPAVTILEQRLIGKGHLRLTLTQTDADSLQRPNRCLPAIAWRWGDYHPLPSQVDIAYRLRLNEWQGDATIQLELVGVRPASTPTSSQEQEFDYADRRYTCTLIQASPSPELRIRNDSGKLLVVQQGQPTALLGTSYRDAKLVNVCQAPYYQIVKAAVQALGLGSVTGQ